jgi:hypothetical protein
MTSQHDEPDAERDGCQQVEADEDDQTEERAQEHEPYQTNAHATGAAQTQQRQSTPEERSDRPCEPSDNRDGDPAQLMVLAMRIRVRSRRSRGSSIPTNPCLASHEGESQTSMVLVRDQTMGHGSCVRLLGCRSSPGCDEAAWNGMAAFGSWSAERSWPVR